MYCQCKVRREADERRTIVVLGQKGYEARAEARKRREAQSLRIGARNVMLERRLILRAGRESSINPNRRTEEGSVRASTTS